MFLLVSVRHVDANPAGHQHGVSIQISIYLGKTFLRISRIRNILLTWIMARVFAYIPPFISQILDFIYWTVLILILIYFEWRDTENQQYDWRQFMNAAKIRPDLRFMHMHSQVSKHRFGDFFPLLSLSLRCSISQMTKMCFSFLFFFLRWQSYA